MEKEALITAMKTSISEEEILIAANTLHNGLVAWMVETQDENSKTVNW